MLSLCDPRQLGQICNSLKRNIVSPQSHVISSTKKKCKLSRPFCPFNNVKDLCKFLQCIGTASDDIAAVIRTYKQGHPYRCDRLGYVNIGVGKVDMIDVQQLHVQVFHSMNIHVTIRQCTVN